MGWADALDDMEARLAQAELVLRGGAPPSGLQLPPGLGPIPAELVERARRVHADTDRVAAELLEARARLASALRRRPAPEQHPAYIDTRA
ncbi:hypothetical protein K6U06_11685 [Acidiferrimicrobium sp. IK]|uniref:hypothetical protein n=1 Tax=Acidiferrimicrobium sp. IK TaxID=2871700 RepID=UPI0021CAF703|nr:hypothetical protein [Acidiferrimicrobium sp. IK]MCU4185024.1 hypothetical protein [Acidiferrimicrobium sp. IK]